MTSTFSPDKRCPCGSGLNFGQCCKNYHDGTLAPTAETLMRSRFSAFVTCNENYLLRTWDPLTRPVGPLALKEMPITFYRLDIVSTQGGGLLDDVGVVEFEAFYKGNPSGSQHEISTFRRIDGAWYYSDGDISQH